MKQQLYVVNIYSKKNILNAQLNFAKLNLFSIVLQLGLYTGRKTNRCISF